MADLADPAYVDRYAEFLAAVGARPLGRAGRRVRATRLALDEGEGALAWVPRRSRREVNRAIAYTHRRDARRHADRGRRAGRAPASARTWPT